MTKISGSTTFFKRIFPVFWLVLLALIFLLNLSIGEQSISSTISFIVVGCLGFLLIKKMFSGLADEVYDCGMHLLFKKGDLEQAVPLDEVINVRHSDLTSQERVTLTVPSAGSIGTELSFLSVAKLNPGAKSKIRKELVRRIDEARS